MYVDVNFFFVVNLFMAQFFVLFFFKEKLFLILKL